MMEVHTIKEVKMTAPTEQDQQVQAILHSEHYVNRQIAYHPPQIPGQGPACIWCNAPTQKTGSCYTCISCGETTGCG